MVKVSYKTYKINGTLEGKVYTFKSKGEAIFQYTFENAIQIVSLIVDEYLPNGDYDLIEYYVSLYGDKWTKIIPLNRVLEKDDSYFIRMPIKTNKIYIKIVMKQPPSGEIPYIENLTVKGK